MKEVREKERKDAKKVRLPQINNCIEKTFPVKRKERGRKLQSLSAGCRIPQSKTLPRIGGIVNESVSRSTHNLDDGHLGVECKHGRRASSSSAAERTQRLIALRSAVLRPVSDPVLAMLTALHRLTLACDARPPEGIDHKRRLLEHFRRKIFARSASAESIKIHLRKLSMETQEKVELDLGYSDYRIVIKDLPLYGECIDEKITRVTYEQVACILRIVYTEAFPDGK